VHLGGLPLEAAAADMNAAPHAQRGRQSTSAVVDALDKAIESLEEQQQPALAARLLFRRDLLRSLSAFRGKQKGDLAEAAKGLEGMVRQVASARATADLRTSEQAPEQEPVLGFDPTLNNHLTPPSPPRQLKVS
jgi:hypothetical protein